MRWFGAGVRAVVAPKTQLPVAAVVVAALLQKLYSY
jgi:hypothetical protein